MVIPNIYLTPVELQAVEMLAAGQNYEILKKEFGLNAQTLCPFLGNIRRKTGILSAKDPQQAQDYLAGYAKAMSGPGPDAKQIEVLERTAGVGYKDHPLTALGNCMGMDQSKAVDLYQAALESAGIMTPDSRECRVQARIYLATRFRVTGGRESLTENHLKVLRLYAQGVRDYRMADELGPEFTNVYSEMLIREGCERLGCIARGRGVQRRLVAAALAQMDRESNTPPHDHRETPYPNESRISDEEAELLNVYCTTKLKPEFLLRVSIILDSIGITARKREDHIPLIRAILRRRAEQKQNPIESAPVTPDDPMF
jgi:hypothetical protein